jgi:hypothetical protein
MWLANESWIHKNATTTVVVFPQQNMCIIKHSRCHKFSFIKCYFPHIIAMHLPWWCYLYIIWCFYKEEGEILFFPLTHQNESSSMSFHYFSCSYTTAHSHTHTLYFSSWKIHEYPADVVESSSHDSEKSSEKYIKRYFKLVLVEKKAKSFFIKIIFFTFAVYSSQVLLMERNFHSLNSHVAHKHGENERIKSIIVICN